MHGQLESVYNHMGMHGQLESFYNHLGKHGQLESVYNHLGMHGQLESFYRHFQFICTNSVDKDTCPVSEYNLKGNILQTLYTYKMSYIVLPQS